MSVQDRAALTPTSVMTHARWTRSHVANAHARPIFSMCEDSRFLKRLRTFPAKGDTRHHLVAWERVRMREAVLGLTVGISAALRRRHGSRNETTALRAPERRRDGQSSDASREHTDQRAQPGNRLNVRPAHDRWSTRRNELAVVQHLSPRTSNNAAPFGNRKATRHDRSRRRSVDHVSTDGGFHRGSTVGRLAIVASSPN